MKKIFLLLFLLPTFIFAQDKLDGVWGLTFGIDQDSVKKSIKRKIDSVPKVTDNGNILSYEKVSFGGKTAELLRLFFYKNKLYSADIYIFPEKDPEILSLYKSLKSSISEKYWEPQVSVESYKSPYEKGDGHELMAIKGGYSTIGCIWTFPSGKESRDDPQGEIMATVDSKIWVKITYQDCCISKEVQKLAKEKTSSDF